MEETLRNLPMEDVHILDNTDASFDRPEIGDMVTEWQARVMALIIEMVLSLKGESRERAKMEGKVYREMAVEMGGRGTIFKTLLVTVVARKKMGVLECRIGA